MESNKLYHIQALALCLTLVVLQPRARAADVDSVCAFSKDPKPALHLDPWARSGEKVKRFGSIENSDEVLIQSCKNIDGKFIALSLGNKEPSLANDSASILFREDLGADRCEITSGVVDNKSLAAKRHALKISRLRTLRACVALEVMSLNSRPLVFGNHSSCHWESLSANRYLARGATCTVRADRGIAISVKPVFESRCLEAAAFESGEVRAADLDTVLQAVVAETGDAGAVGQTIGVTKRRILIAPSPALAKLDDDETFRLPKTFGLTIKPVSAEIITERERDTATSFVSMSWFVQNSGEWFNAYQVPLAAEAELIEVGPSGRPRTVMNWLAYSTGQTLVPADWDGLFTVNRAQIPDFAFKHGRRYRIRLRYLHPHDAPGLIKADMEQSAPVFEQTPSSFQTQLFPKSTLIKKVPGFNGFPTLGKGPQESQTSGQLDNTEKEILRFFRSLGIDSVFPARYNRACVGSTCASAGQVTYVGESFFDFTADAIPGQVGDFKPLHIESKTRMLGQSTPSEFQTEFKSESNAEVLCP